MLASSDFIDEPQLEPSFCVWLTSDTKAHSGLSGRYLSAKWDVDELMDKKDTIVEHDLLKARLHNLQGGTGEP